MSRRALLAALAVATLAACTEADLALLTDVPTTPSARPGASAAPAAGASVRPTTAPARPATPPAGPVAAGSDMPAAIGAPAERATADRPDDLAGYQVHVVYMIPSDAPDEALDTNGTIASSIQALNDHVARETEGRRVRFDMAGGALDVSFFRREVGEEMASTQIGSIEYELWKAGFDDKRKLYLVYYGGLSSKGACGTSNVPPDVVTWVPVLWLRDGEEDAAEGEEAFECAKELSFDPGSTTIRSWHVTALHEIVHSLGAVGPGAPHHALNKTGHVVDDDADLMYAEDFENAAAGARIHLDPGHDDYLDHGGTHFDLARSAFLSPLPADAAPPPGWHDADADPREWNKDYNGGN